MMTGLSRLLLKGAALFSFCGGPLLLSDRLRPRFGTNPAFVVTVTPVLIMLMGALSLEDDPVGRFARAAVWSGCQATYVVTAMNTYAVWAFLNGLRIKQQWLYYLGITVGLVWAVVYLRRARRWRAGTLDNTKRGAEQLGAPPIEPS